MDEQMGGSDVVSGVVVCVARCGCEERPWRVWDCTAYWCPGGWVVEGGTFVVREGEEGEGGARRRCGRRWHRG